MPRRPGGAGLPDLLAFFDRETQLSDEEAAVLEALEAIGKPVLPALYARLERSEDPYIRRLVAPIDAAD